MNDNPMHPAQRLQDAPRCTAMAKSTRTTCQAPAVNGWSVCRMHGARGGQPPGKAHPAWKHGLRSRKWVEVRRSVGELVREVACLVGGLS